MLNQNTKHLYKPGEIYHLSIVIRISELEKDKQELVSAYRRLFNGRDDIWGKLEGECVKGVPDYYRHLNGQQSLGIYPLTPEGYCSFAVIDIDYKTAENSKHRSREVAVQLIRSLRKRNIGEVWIERTKSDLIHLWLFFSEPVEAKKVRRLLSHVIESNGYKVRNGEIEVFPKQDSLQEGRFGSYINLPYFGGLKELPNRRVMLHPKTLKPMSVEEFVAVAENNLITPAVLDKAYNKIHKRLEDAAVSPGPTNFNNILNATQRQNIIDVMDRYWHEGIRQDLTMCLSGFLAGNEVPEQETLEIVKAIVKKCDDIELNQRLASVKATYEKLHKGEEILGYSGLQTMLETSDLQELSAIIEPPVKDSQYPAPLSEDAYCGLAGEFVRTVEPHSESDPAALLFSFLAGIGCLVGPRPYYKVESSRHGTKLFVAIVGDTAKSRKGTSWDNIENLLVRVDESIAERIQGGLSSGEGLISAITNADDERLLIVESEFASVLTIANRQGNTLSEVVRNAWDRGRLQTMTRKSPLFAPHSHITIVTHITELELKDKFTNLEAANGFGNRFLWVCVQRSKSLPYGGDLKDEDLASIVKKLKNVLEFAKETEEIAWAEDAKPIWEKVYPKLSEGESSITGAMTARSEAYVVRLACIYALLDKSDKIRRKHLKAALEVWRYAEDSVRYLFGGRERDGLKNRLYEYLLSNPKGASRTDINKYLGGKVKSGAISHALNELNSEGKAYEETKKTQGRDVEVWLPMLKQ